MFSDDDGEIENNKVMSGDAMAAAARQIAARLSGYSTPSSFRPSTAVRDSFTVDASKVELTFDGARSPGQLSSSSSVNEVLQGTITGVFIPCCQNILGVIMFLRVGWITGQAGLWMTTGLMLLCVTATTLTSLSLSALATNGKVAAGGPYYVVSRSLGPAFGGAIGILFYLGTTIAGSMYALGTIEAVHSAFGMDDGILGLGEDVKLMEMRVGGVLVLASAGLAVRTGTTAVNTVSVAVFGIVAMSVVMMVLGLIFHAAGIWHPPDVRPSTIVENLPPSFEEDPDSGVTPSFTIMLGILFPGFTGIMAGTNRSGQLRDAGRSIPTGTLAAIASTFFLNLGVAWLGGAVDRNLLKRDKTILATIAWPHAVPVAIGICCSCVGATLQCLAGSAQLLLAIVRDDTPTTHWLKQYTGQDALVGRRSNDDEGEVEKMEEKQHPQSPTVTKVAKATTKATETGEEKSNPKEQGLPPILLAINVLIAGVCCLPGNLDMVTPIITMFFLVMYASINGACCLLALLRTPGFRPRWRLFHWTSALAGVLVCTSLMFIIAWYAAVTALLMATALYQYISIKGAEKDYGDSLRGVRLASAKQALLALRNPRTLVAADAPEHSKNWRPQLLVLVSLKEKNRDGGVVEFQSEINRTALFELTRPSLLRVAQMLKKGRGLTMVRAIIQGSSLNNYDVGTRRPAASSALWSAVTNSKLEGFAGVTLAGDYRTGLDCVLQEAGLAALKPNAVMVAWPLFESGGEEESVSDFVYGLKVSLALKKALIVVKNPEGFPNVKVGNKTIDIWWMVHDGGMLLLLPYLLQQHKIWRGCRLRLFMIARAGRDIQRLHREYSSRTAELRIDVELKVIAVESHLVRAAENNRTVAVRADRRKRYVAQVDAGSTLTVRAPKRKRSRSTSFSDGAAVLASIFTSPLPKGSSGVAEVEKNAALSSELKSNTALRKIILNKRKLEEKTQTPPPPSPSQYKMETLSSGKAKRNSLNASRSASDIAFEGSTFSATAKKVNEEIRKYSSEAALVVANLPLTRRLTTEAFIDFTRTLTAEVDHMMLIRGSGYEVVTSYA